MFVVRTRALITRPVLQGEVPSLELVSCQFFGAGSILGVLQIPNFFLKSAFPLFLVEIASLEHFQPQTIYGAYITSSTATKC